MVCPPHHSVGLFWVPGHSGTCGHEVADRLAREGSMHHFIGLEPALGVSRQSIRKKNSVLAGQTAHDNVAILLVLRDRHEN
jgi:ribonuclease HI